MDLFDIFSVKKKKSRIVVRLSVGRFNDTLFFITHKRHMTKRRFLDQAIILTCYMCTNNCGTSFVHSRHNNETICQTLYV